MPRQIRVKLDSKSVVEPKPSVFNGCYFMAINILNDMQCRKLL